MDTNHFLEEKELVYRMTGCAMEVLNKLNNTKLEWKRVVLSEH